MSWWVLIGTLLGLMVIVAPWLKSREERMLAKHAREIKQEKKNAEVHEQRLQAFLSAIQASPNGVIILDGEQRIEWCNQTAAHLLGLDATRDVAQHIVHLVRHPQFLEYLASGHFEQELTFDNKALQLHPYGEGRALLLVRDITALERADQMRRDFVANVSHEIRTPLTVLSGFIETLLTLSLNDDDRTRYLGLMSTQSQRLGALVNDLLMLSKLDAEAKPVFERVNMTELLRQCEREAMALLSSLKREMTITYDVPPSTFVMGVTSELQSACSNLVANAVRYTPAGGTVTVTWMQSALVVQDTGIGIAPEHLPRLTERFYRVDKSRNREAGDVSGTGLGLAIVKHVAQRHGAKLEIESTVGVGSTFRLIF
jgi:two-component system phosphate regulon sensor histidine kinase PhoR